MFNIVKEELMWAGRPLTLETGKIARQANGSVVATYGQTSVLATVVYASEPKPGLDFVPLTVNYQERSYAAGRIPGGYFKREGRSTEKETLVSRLIDRPIRPLFPSTWTHETQIIVTVLTHDMENDSDILSIVAASAALSLAGIPSLEKLAGARVGIIDDQFVLNPTLPQMQSSTLDLVLAGTRNALLMVESEAKELSEGKMVEALQFGFEGFKPVIQLIDRLVEKASKPEATSLVKDFRCATQHLEKHYKPQFENLLQPFPKKEKHALLTSLIQLVCDEMLTTDPVCDVTQEELTQLCKAFYGRLLRENILTNRVRSDGRALETIRPLDVQVDLLPRAHGSALFTRGETQALVVATLGTGEDEQYIDALEGLYKETFLLHYNFPPYSVGEVGRIGAPGRREIGHGKLAWRAIRPLLPSFKDFPYTLRVVSEITESNGSSSMATVCGTSLALMDAGIPLKRHVAGIAMGLILEGDRYAVLTDIMGEEDHLGDMDFKVAGSDEGITALQMDIKIQGITLEIIEKALGEAHRARLTILEAMKAAVAAPRSELKAYAPRIEVLRIPVDKIREVIGTGGKIIREIIDKTGAKINIDDDGLVRVTAISADSIQAAMTWIHSIVDEPEVGETYTGRVVKLVEFGAFVNFFGARDGLVHISEIANKRIERVTDVLTEGQTVRVKLLGKDDRGKIRLSMKGIPQDIEAE